MTIWRWALVALKSRNLVGKVALIGFDALPEALGEVKAGNVTATIEQKPGGQRSQGSKLRGWRQSLSPGTMSGRPSALAK
jgi:ABC-type sugar transport system substrate-binding protein